MKRFVILLAVCVIALPLMMFAQGEPGYGKSTLGANFELSVPVGDFSNYGGIGYGGNVKYQYGAETRSVFTATAGYIVWGKKDYGNTTTPGVGAESVQWKAFNLFAGGKYYFAPGFFGTLEGGVYFLSASYEGGLAAATGTATYFMLPIGLGYQKSGFEVGVRYMLLHPDFNQFSFTVGYNFAI
jgi:hypothetical protein